MTSTLLPWLENLSHEDWDRRPAGEWRGRPPADPTALSSAEKWFGTRFPEDYRELMLASDSGSLIGPRETLSLEPLEGLAAYNADDEFQMYLPGMIVIGDNGGEAVYFYDPENGLGRGRWAVYWVELGDLALDNAHFAGSSLEDTLQRIAGGVFYFDEPPHGSS